MRGKWAWWYGWCGTRSEGFVVGKYMREFEKCKVIKWGLWLWLACDDDMITVHSEQ